MRTPGVGHQGRWPNKLRKCARTTIRPARREGKAIFCIMAVRSVWAWRACLRPPIFRGGEGIGLDDVTVVSTGTAEQPSYPLECQQAESFGFGAISLIFRRDVHLGAISSNFVLGCFNQLYSKENQKGMGHAVSYFNSSTRHYIIIQLFLCQPGSSEDCQKGQPAEGSRALLWAIQKRQGPLHLSLLGPRRCLI